MLENIRLIAGSIILVLYFGMVPIVLGSTIGNILCKGRKVDIAESYIWGNIILWVIFQLLSVPMGVLGIEFNVLTIVFVGIILMCMVVAIWRYRRKFVIPLYYVKNLRIEEWLVIFIILGQVCISVFGATYIGADDAAYIATSVDAVERDAISVFNPYTGQEGGVSIKILLTSWNYYISFLSKISGIHVAAIAHTFLPIVLIPMAYIVYWLIAKFLFANNRKKVCVFLLWINFIIIFGAYSWYTLTLRLDICVWHGKAVMAAIMLPFLFYYLLRTSEYGKKELLCLLLIMIATCAMSLMGVGLTIVIVIAAFVVKCKKCNIKKMMPLLLAVAVISIVVVFYFFWGHHANKLQVSSIREFFPQAVSMALGANSLYWGKGWMQWFYYICMAYLLLGRKKNEKDKFFLKYVIWQYILIYNPIFVYIAYIFLKRANVYVRLYYTLFPELCMAYVLTLIIFKLEGKKKQALCGVICGGIIMRCGTPYPQIANFSKSENIYKIPQEVVELCDMVNEDAEESPKVVADEGVIVYIRQYSSRIQMLYGRWGYTYNGREIFKAVRNNEITMAEIAQMMEENDCQYLVWRYNQVDILELEALGGSVVGNTDNYVVIRMNDGAQR